MYRHAASEPVAVPRTRALSVLAALVRASDTGPMYNKYNAVLRAAGENAPAQLKKLTGILCLRNKYTTTLHVINSGVVKLGKLTKAGTVYRGLSGGTVSYTHLTLPTICSV